MFLLSSCRAGGANVGRALCGVQTGVHHCLTV